MHYHFSITFEPFLTSNDYIAGNARTKFLYQLEIIRNAMIDKCILLGDFNLNYDKIYDDNYAHRALFDDFENVLSHE